MNFILWMQFIFSVLQRKGVVCFANIFSHLIVVTEEQCNDLLFN